MRPQGGAHVVLGFCFDAKSNDYRVVRIIRNKKPRVEVYSFRTDSWKTLECEVPFLCDSAVFLNGNLHWYSVNEEGGEYGSIVLFNVADEVFDEIALPEGISPHFEFVLSLTVLNDSLAVFFGDGEACFVWVMKDYGVPESWTKLYTFEATGPVTRLDGFTWNGELLMEINFEERVSWNPITAQLSILPLLARYELLPVVESLVPP
ncbi:F-box protein CPR1-like [Eucalyptus grandis]|uniref:F-box protein CPR1-like n=1 Tax=Eucalyptus grandis TaxID=71139 RepID=UPI00192F032E|nr:F-box protein CPR1-like [Eucalyptus grandis]